MQTFLPYSDFKKSAQCLDYRRLGKQRVEAFQIFQALTIPSYGWKNHPAVKMWKGCESGLIFYGLAVCVEWRKRGFNDTMLERFLKLSKHYKCFVYPSWLGDENFHSSHRSNLLRKDIDYYSKFNWCEDSSKEYVWPVVN